MKETSEPTFQQLPSSPEEDKFDIDEEHDSFELFFQNYYFPFLLRYHKFVLIAWVAIFAVSITFGPKFLSETRSNLDLPKGTSSELAIEAFSSNYPSTSSWPSAFVISHSPHENIIGPEALDVSQKLQIFASTQPTISSVTGYYEFLQIPELKPLAQTSISPSNHTMMTTISFAFGATLSEIQATVRNLIEFSIEESRSDLEVYTTGLFPLFADMTDATEKNFIIIDGTVLPIALVILGVSVRSYRHIFVALINIICMLLLAFAILVPIAQNIDINPFSPTIMLSLGIAISFDYSLFQLTRFKEECNAGKTTEEAVLSSLMGAGHVVIVSGSTLFCTFLLLLALPQNFLQSVGFSCSAAVFSAMIVNISLTPSLLLYFHCLSFFDICPSTESFCCWISPNHMRTIPIAAAYSQVPNQETQIVIVESPKSALPETLPTSSPPSDLDEEQGVKIGEERGGQDSQLTPSPPSTPIAETISTKKVSASDSKKKTLEQMRKPQPRTFFFYVSLMVTRYAWVVLLVAIGITIPFVITFLRMTPTSDAQLIYLRGSRSLKGYEIMNRDFPVGQLDPYQIIVTTDQPGVIFTPDYFEMELNIIHSTLQTISSKYVDQYSLTAVSYYQGTNISFDTFLAYTDSTSILYNTSEASAYRIFALPRVNQDQSASLITVITLVDPNSEAVVPFIKHTRSLLTSLTHNPPVSSQSTNTFPGLGLFLFGGYTTTLDVQDLVYGFVPIMISTTIIVVLLIVGLSFGSIALVLRLAITAFISLSWTYGFMILVYQPGPSQRAFEVLTPALSSSTGIYWIIPLMSFSILVGLALDYDIFLMARVIEFRKLGWSDRASCILAVEKSGMIISAAGLIMSISFAGLLLPKTTVLNQYGFSLFIGVAIDTFIVRTIIVPAVVTSISFNNTLNWWPGKMPEPLLTIEEEDQLLMAGYDLPDAKLLNLLGGESNATSPPPNDNAEIDAKDMLQKENIETSGLELVPLDRSHPTYSPPPSFSITKEDSEPQPSSLCCLPTDSALPSIDPSL